MAAYLLAFVVFFAAVAMAYFAGPLLHLEGTSLLLLSLLTCILGAAAAAAILYYRKGAEKSSMTANGVSDGSSGDLNLLLQDAARKLAAAQQVGPKSLDRMPLIYLLGDAGSAKTTSVVQSGLEPELLAGQVYRSGDVMPTPLVNLWYTQQAAILEAGEGVRSSAQLFSKLVRRTRPKPHRALFGATLPARAAVVCVSAERFLGGEGPLAWQDSARHTGAQLREISRILGAAVPIYVVITKLDRVPYFAAYVRNLSGEEAQQVLGTTLTPRAASSGVYAEEASQRIGQALDKLFYSLGEFRLELLEREPGQQNAADVYEFPRELRKLRNSILEYLVELSRPSQLSANPYLRGFYFTGVRAQVIEQIVSASTPVQTTGNDPGATRMFALEDMQRQPAAQPERRVTQKVPQWTFLPRIFPRVVLGDTSALSASGKSTPARLFRRVLFGAIAAVCLVYLGLLFISYGNNRALEKQILTAESALAQRTGSAGATVSIRELEALDGLRRVIVQLEGYRQNGAPLMYRWGLYQGDRLARGARARYFDRFRPLLLDGTQAHLAATLGALPAAPPAGASYTEAYNPLKAYLITTSNPEKSTPEFLSPMLIQYWPGNNSTDGDAQRLAREQMDFYANELRRANPYTIAPETAAVNRARQYLSEFGGVDRIYQGMLAAAEKGNPPIEFNRQYPRAGEAVVDGHVVPGAFTRSGFAFMQDAILHPGRYFSGETWVLGEQSAPSLDSAAIAQGIKALYTADYLKEWHAFLSAANVVAYRSLPDAAAKLNLLASPTSPLLELFYTVSHNTAVGDPAIARAFQPAAALVQPDSADRLIGSGNTAYINGLLGLQGSIAQVAQNAAAAADPNAGLPILTAATAAHIAARQTAQSFTIDPQGHTETTTLNLLEAPIKSAEGLVRGIGPAAANAGGRTFCATFDALMAKFPFAANAVNQASAADVSAVFAPDTGALWQFYNANLKTLLIPQGPQYVPAPGAPVQVTPGFNRFFNRAAAISAGFFPQGAKTPALTFSLREVPTKGVQNATLSIDGQRVSSPNAAQPFTWNVQSAQGAQLSASYLDAKDVPLLQTHGTWALFELLSKARAQRTGTGTQLDFPLEISNSPIKLPDGTPLVVEFNLSGSGAELLTPDAFNGLRCVSQVAR